MTFTNDDREVQLCHHCAVAFGWTPEQTLSQDETFVADMLLLDRQINFVKWAMRHDVEIEEPAPFWPEAVDYKKGLGLG